MFQGLPANLPVASRVELPVISGVLRRRRVRARLDRFGPSAPDLPGSPQSGARPADVLRAGSRLPEDPSELQRERVFRRLMGQLGSSYDRESAG